MAIVNLILSKFFFMNHSVASLDSGYGYITVISACYGSVAVSSRDTQPFTEPYTCIWKHAYAHMHGMTVM